MILIIYANLCLSLASFRRINNFITNRYEINYFPTTFNLDFLFKINDIKAEMDRQKSVISQFIATGLISTEKALMELAIMINH